ncbi:MAG: hypothetical protein WCW29_04345 [Candidatus Paceibacterota bacterium]|jgi:hypothetical protein
MNEVKKEYELDFTDKTIDDLLFELYDTIYWPLIKELTRREDEVILSSLASIDPIKDATLIARNQGMRSGIYLLQEKIAMVAAVRNEK